MIHAMPSDAAGAAAVQEFWSGHVVNARCCLLLACLTRLGSLQSCAHKLRVGCAYLCWLCVLVPTHSPAAPKHMGCARLMPDKPSHFSPLTAIVCCPANSSTCLYLCFSCCSPKSRHYSLATYILLRGITLLIRTGNKPRAAARHPLLHAALAPTRLAHGDTLLMCCAASQIVYAFIMMPQTLPPSYVRFIRKQGAKELYVWRGIRVRS